MDEIQINIEDATIHTSLNETRIEHIQQEQFDEILQQINDIKNKLGQTKAQLTDKGYYKTPEGLIIQWVVQKIPPPRFKPEHFIKLPIVFPNKMLSVSCETTLYGWVSQTQAFLGTSTTSQAPDTIRINFKNEQTSSEHYKDFTLYLLAIGH